MGRSLRIVAFGIAFGMVLGGLASAAQSAPVGVLDPNSLRFASTPQASLASLAWQQLGLNGPIGLSPFNTPMPTYTVPPSHSNDPGGATPFVDPEWNRKMVPGNNGPVAGVPEPGAALLFAAGFGLVALKTRRR